MEGATHPGDVCLARTAVKRRTQYMKEQVLLMDAREEGKEEGLLEGGDIRDTERISDMLRRRKEIPKRIIASTTVLTWFFLGLLFVSDTSYILLPSLSSQFSFLSLWALNNWITTHFVLAMTVYGRDLELLKQFSVVSELCCSVL